MSSHSGSQNSDELLNETDHKLTKQQLRNFLKDQKNEKITQEPVFKRFGDQDIKVKDKITEANIKTDWLKDIFGGKSENVIKKIKLLQTTKEWKQDFEFDLIVAFWMAVEKEDFKLANSLMSYDISLKCIATLAMQDISELKPSFNPKDIIDDHDRNLSFNKTIKKEKKDQIFSNTMVNTQKQTIQQEGGEFNFQIKESTRGDDNEDEDSSLEKEDNWGGDSDDTDGKLSGDLEDPENNEKSIVVDNQNDSKNKQKPNFSLFFYNIDNNKMVEKFKKYDINGSIIEMTQITSLQQVQKVKMAFKLRSPILMANIAQILLYYDEIDLACYLTAYYEIQCDEHMIQNAICDDYFQWLNYLWVFDKNYVSVNINKKNVMKKFNFYMLFKKVTNLFSENKIRFPKEKKDEKDENDETKIVKREKLDAFRIICEWKVVPKNLVKKKITLCYKREEQNNEQEAQNKNDEEQELNQDDYENNDKEDNILQSLLIFQQDQLCIEYMGYYQQFLNEDLFLFSIKKNNEKFIENSLKIGAFTKDVFKLDKVVNQIIESFEIGSKAYFLLNILNMTDISVWKTQQLLNLMEKFQHFVEERFENNRMSSCSNPIMIICLSCEILQKIAQNKKSLSDQCLSLKQNLLELGQTISMKIDDDDEYYALVTDKDFQNRSILKIITECRFYDLMTEEDGKAENILNNFYVGEKASQCDGNIFGYSILVHMLTQKAVKKTEDTMKSFYDMITLSYEPNLKQDYVFQHCYRKKGINNYFIKEFIFSLAISIITILIYYDYIVTFKGFDYTLDPSTFDIIPEIPPFDKNNYLDDTFISIDKISLVMNSEIYAKSNITNSTINYSKIVNSTIINSIISNSSVYNSTVINSTYVNVSNYNYDGINIKINNQIFVEKPKTFVEYNRGKTFIYPQNNQNDLESNQTSQDSQQSLNSSADTQDSSQDQSQNFENITDGSQDQFMNSTNSTEDSLDQSQSATNTTDGQEDQSQNSTNSTDESSQDNSQLEDQTVLPVYGQTPDFSQSLPNWIEKWRYYQYCITGIVLLTPLLRIYFNLMPKDPSVNNIFLDFFLVVDIVFAVATFIAFYVISSLDHTFLEDRARKFNLDILIAVLMGLVLWKTFQLYLIVSSISKMLVSLAGLFMGTLAFTFVNVFYILFATQLLYTIYYDKNTTKYPNMMTAGQQSYNTFMAAYDTAGFTDNESEYLFSALQYLLFVIGNLVLLTIMVALMMSYFDQYSELSSFLYKCFFYQYLERYLTAFQDELYGEIVVHNPPFNLFVLLIIPFTPFPSIMAQVSDIFSKIIFWMENILFIFVFLIFEVCLTPLVYLITFFNILFCTPGIFTTTAFIIWWSGFGIFYLLYMLMYDTYYLILILSYHDGCKLVEEQINEARQQTTQDLQNKAEVPKKPISKQSTEMQDLDYVRVYNEMRTLVIEHYQKQSKLYRLQKQEQQEEDEQEKEAEIDEAFDVLAQIQKDIDLGDLDPVIFQCKLVSLHDQWRSFQSTKKKNEENKEAQPADVSKVQYKSTQPLEQQNQKIDIKTILRQTLIGQKMNNQAFEDEQKIIEWLIEQFGDPKGQAVKTNEDEDKAQNNDYSTEEDHEVEEFLNKFLVGNESSFLDTIDIVLMLRALPSSINHIDKVKKAKLFNFPNLQNSLTAFINKESVGSFEYYDEKNKDRVEKIKNRLQIQHNELKNVMKIVDEIKKSALENQSTLQEFKELWDKIEKSKNVDEGKNDKYKGINQKNKQQKSKQKK